LQNSNFQKLNTEANFYCESQNDFDLNSKKKKPSSSDLYYQLYDKKAFEAQVAKTDAGAYFQQNRSETNQLRVYPRFASNAENSNLNNFSLNSNSNFANFKNEIVSKLNANALELQETCDNKLKIVEAGISNKNANLNSENSNLNKNNFISNSKTDKNLKNNSAQKQNMVKAQISKSPVEAQNLEEPKAYLDENQMDIENPQDISNQGNFYPNDFPSNNLNNGDLKYLNSGSTNNFPIIEPKSNANNINHAVNSINNLSTANYAFEVNSYISTKENLKINSAAESKNNFPNNANNINLNKKNSTHNFNNYKKKPSALTAAYSKQTNPINNNNTNYKYNLNANNLNSQRQNITNIATINHNSKTNNQIQSKINLEHYSKFVPILQKHEKSIPLEYIPEIWRSLKTSENCAACMPKYDSLLNQADINFDMRAILVDWIIDVHKNYRLLPETLFICISIIDRYLTKKQILRTRLQLLGTTALFISSKYEEIIYPCIEEFTKVTDDAYNKEEVLQMETEIFQLLEFELTYPSAFRFFEIISLNYNFSEVEFYYGCYMLEYFLISPNCNKYFPSVIALAIVLLILKIKNYENYRDLYSLADSLESQRLVKQCAKEIYEFPATGKNFNLHSVFNKYSSSLYHCVALNELDGHQQPSAADAAENPFVNQNK
jgi:G2/mitotic-specific cyclin 1/2